MIIRPREIFLTKGMGRHKAQLASFEEAIRDAQIAEFNLVPVSSIAPPNCKILPRAEGLKKLQAGEVVFVVMSRNQTDENQRLVAASVGLALPKDRNMHGYLSEHHSFGQTEEEAGDFAEDLAASMLATVLGVQFDPEADWDSKKEIYRISGRIVRTSNATQSAIGRKNGIWTTVVAAAVVIG